MDADDVIGEWGRSVAEQLQASGWKGEPLQITDAGKGEDGLSVFIFEWESETPAS